MLKLPKQSPPEQMSARNRITNSVRPSGCSIGEGIQCAATCANDPLSAACIACVIKCAS